MPFIGLIEDLRTHIFVSCYILNDKMLQGHWMQAFLNKDNI